jgi:lipopolysaccharide/colanic/teichoic acid biosynthesis glycosyltransferase
MKIKHIKDIKQIDKKRYSIKEILKDLFDFIGLFFLFYITYNLLLLIAYLIK